MSKLINNVINFNGSTAGFGSFQKLWLSIRFVTRTTKKNCCESAKSLISLLCLLSSLKPQPQPTRLMGVFEKIFHQKIRINISFFTRSICNQRQKSQYEETFFPNSFISFLFRYHTDSSISEVFIVKNEKGGEFVIETHVSMVQMSEAFVFLYF